MTDDKPWDWGKILFRTAATVYVIALVAYYFHAVDLNPQADTQGIRYSLELLSAKDQGQLWNWLTQIPVRKYPMLFVLPFSVAESFFWISGEGMEMTQAHYITRAITVLYALGTFWILRRITVRLFDDSRSATLLLLTSINFFLFSSAVRPHIAVGFWTLLTFYLSLQLRQQPSGRKAVLAFASAACAFATLQSGLLAFIFPLWAMTSENWSWKSVTKTLGLAAGMGAIGLAVGYPFVLNMFSGSSPTAGFTTGINHDVGIFLLPQLIPVKLWEMFTCDIILFIAAGFGIFRTWHEKQKIIPVLLYLAAFWIVFGMQPTTGPRFFVPTLPLIAVLATPALAGRRKLQMGIAVLCILIFGKLAYLATQPNTYQQASQFVNTHDGLLITHTPTYFLNVPDEKYAKAGQPAKRFFILLQEDEHIPEVEVLPLCAVFTARDVSAAWSGVKYMFFWHEVPWPLYYLAVTKSLGINLRMYCSLPL